MGCPDLARETLAYKKRVLLFESDSLLAASLASLLLTLSDIEVVYVTLAALGGTDALALAHSDVVILEDTLVHQHLAELLPFIETFSSVRAVILNSEHNFVQVFDKQVLLVNQLSDFVDVVSGRAAGSWKKE